jgi:hypothetical protein
MNHKFLQVVLVASLVILTGCKKSTSAIPFTVTASLLSPSTETPSPAGTFTPTSLPSPTPPPTLTPTPTIEPTLAPIASGPDSFPAGVNPLTGMQVADPSLLDLIPGLVSITNSPSGARPQSGFSYAAQVFEFYIGEGATRFLAVFYGDYPPDPGLRGEKTKIGPIRSGRLHYETLREFYGGFLVFASAMQKVRDKLKEYIIVTNPDPTTINGAYIPVQTMLQNSREIREDTGKSPALFGNRFDPLPPAGGKPASRLWMNYGFYAQVFWDYDALRGLYLRSQGDDRGNPPVPAIDRLTGLQPGFENVIVLFSNYVRYSDVYFNIDFKYVNRWPALLFRDGQIYNIRWSTIGGDYEKKSGKLRPIRFIGEDGQPFPLKPGHIWINIVQLHNPVYETVDSQDAYRLTNLRTPGSGIWAVYFIAPELTDEPKYPLPDEE